MQVEYKGREVVGPRKQGPGRAGGDAVPGGKVHLRIKDC